VSRRIPPLVIGSVENGDQLVRVFSNDHIQSASVFWCVHLTAIMLAHRGDTIGEKNSALQEIHPAKELDPAERKIFLGQVRQSEIEYPRTPLLIKMMNGQDSGERQPLFINQDRHQSSRPIVDMKNLRHRSETPGQFQRRFAEKNEAGRIVFIWLSP